MDNFVTPGTPILTVNGTFLTNENIDYMWNISFLMENRLNLLLFILGSFLLMYNSWKFWMCYSFLHSNIYYVFIRLIFLLIDEIFMCWNSFKISDRRFFIPFLVFVACVLLTAGVFDYGSWARWNSHSSRTMIATIVFAYTTLPISAFIAGRYSAFDRFVTNGHVTNGQKYIQTSTNGNRLVTLKTFFSLCLLM